MKKTKELLKEKEKLKRLQNKDFREGYKLALEEQRKKEVNRR